MSDEPEVFSPVPPNPRAIVMIQLMPDGQVNVNCQTGSMEDALVAVGNAVVALGRHKGPLHPVPETVLSN